MKPKTKNEQIQKKQTELRESFRARCMESMDEDKLWDWIQSKLQEREEEGIEEIIWQLKQVMNTGKDLDIPKYILMLQDKFLTFKK